ncbi:MAG: ComEC/Rec2 family competence protein [Prevotella sp.]|nr:ComEC/Rec2 family competence protein [Prevotella sp.]
MNYELTDRPLLYVLLFMMAGIFGGMVFFVSVASTRTSFIVLSVLLLSALFFRNRAVISTLLLLLSSFALGVVLISNSVDRGFQSTISFSAIDRVEEYMADERESLLKVYSDAGLSADEYGIIAAVTLGERNAVSRELKESYRVSGASHLFALSGLHLSIIFALLSVFLPTRMFPKGSAVVQILLLWTYVLLVGIYPSLLRAAVMFTCYCLCRLVSRESHNIDVLILTAFILLVFNPQWLFDVGFQMSFMAMVGIFLLVPPMMKWVKTPVLSYVYGIFVVSFAASLGTFPLIAHYFGRVSCYGLLTNLIASPCIALLLFCAFLMLLSAALQPYLAFLSVVTHALSYILKYVVGFMNGAIHSIASLPGSSVSGVHISFAQVILVYVLIVCVVLIACHIKHGIRFRLHGPDYH